MRSFALCATVVACFLSGQAQAETTECTVIDSVPVTLTVQGVYCLKGDLATGITTGNAIEIVTNNVTIDMNGFKLGGLAAGTATEANGIYASGYKNITIRNGNIRGFEAGIYIDGVSTESTGHLIEDMILDGNTLTGIALGGSGIVVRNNRIVDTGGGTGPTPALAELRSGDAGSGESVVPQADGSVARGIFAVVEDSRIVGNLVSGTHSTGSSHGVDVYFPRRVSIVENLILDTSAPGANAYGVSLVGGGSLVAVEDNTIVAGDGTSASGISVSTTTNVTCLDNTIVDWATPTAGCTSESGTFPGAF